MSIRRRVAEHRQYGAAYSFPRADRQPHQMTGSQYPRMLVSVNCLTIASQSATFIGPVPLGAGGADVPTVLGPATLGPPPPLALPPCAGGPTEADGAGVGVEEFDASGLGVPESGPCDAAVELFLGRLGATLAAVADDDAGAEGVLLVGVALPAAMVTRVNVRRLLHQKALKCRFSSWVCMEPGYTSV